MTRLPYPGYVSQRDVEAVMQTNAKPRNVVGAYTFEFLGHVKYEKPQPIVIPPEIVSEPGIRNGGRRPYAPLKPRKCRDTKIATGCGELFTHRDTRVMRCPSCIAQDPHGRTHGLPAIERARLKAGSPPCSSVKEKV